MRKKRGNNVILICSSSFLFLSLVEIAYRNLFRAREDYFEKGGNAIFFRPDSLLGNQIGKAGVLSSAKLTYAGNTIYRANYTIIADSNENSFGFNHRAGYLNPDVGRAKIIFLGCSFAFGQGVNDSETLPYRLGALKNISTLNLGCMGYGIHHVYEIFKDKYANKRNENDVFIYVMIPDHVLRASGLYDWSAGPSFKLVGDSLVYAGSLPVIDDKVAYYSSLFGCFTFIKDMVINLEIKERAKRVSAEEYEKAYLVVRKMSQYSKVTGGNFLLLFWDKYNFSANDPNMYYRQKLEDETDKLRKDSVNIIRVSDILDINDPKYYIPSDGHPNAVAYDTIAKYLAKHLNFSH